MTDNARDVLVRKISAAMADGKDSGGYTTLLDMYAHIALKVVEANAAAQTGRNRDPIYAPDGKTWYQTALDEASKRGDARTTTTAALDALALALADHGHQWTDRERSLYEAAIAQVT